LSRLLVIVNPAAGRGRAARLWPDVERGLRASGIAFDVALTGKPGEAEELAYGSMHEAVAAAGGDGTVHEIVNGLMRAGAKAALRVIALGSGDDFAKLLVPGAEMRAFDIGRITSDGVVRHFANGMDIGFGAHGAANVARVPRFLTGFGAYLGALALTLLRYPLLRVRIQIDYAPAFDLHTAMTAAMNGTTFGGSFRVTPDGKPDDGLLDLLLVDAVSRLGILRLVPKILRGAHAGDPSLRLLRARRLTIESEAPLLVEADGEIAFRAARRLEIACLPGALRVCA
jgi:diacylglycerol kinase (ATP)